MLSFKVLFFVGCFVMMAKTQADFEYDETPQKLSGGELKIASQALKKALSQLKGAHYRIGTIKSATRHYQSGNFYRFNADLVDGNNETKGCEAGVWLRKKSSQPLQKFVFVQCVGDWPVYEEQKP